MWPEIAINTLPRALAVLTSMITPALLISACGTFILSTSNRLGRVIDRVRVLSDKLEELMQRDEPIELFEQRRSMIFEQMNRLSFRADLLQRSLTVFYVASGVFVATSLAIGGASLFRTDFNWVPVVLGIVGACLLFYGSLISNVDYRGSPSCEDSSAGDGLCKHSRQISHREEAQSLKRGLTGRFANFEFAPLCVVARSATSAMT